MKRFCILLALLIVGARSHAQTVPNGNLETWPTANHAQNWQTTDDILQAVIGIPFATGTTSKTTDKYAGSFAARLETKSMLGSSAIPGSLVLGTGPLNPALDNLGGMPYTGHPAALQLRYKLSGPALATDSAFAGVTLTRRANGRTEVVASGFLFLLQPAAAYTLATVPLQYASNAAPDSVYIMIASGSSSNLTVGTALTVDNIELTGSALASRAETAAAASLSVFPNPSADGLFTLAAPQEPALLQAPVTVHDLTGRLVLTAPAAAPGAASRTISLRGQPAGVYTVRLETPHGLITRRLTLQ
ncbi:T9SS type A sorting domain-containing protein [Hymenobacter properus]|uniref:T9SS type A sorting domain-containing protein n=1 Tax=Hymenobacter properus TaxID=2791026 RepID=A0A931BKH1_9BACT|nr:T9SS type A sorting domain-containing protein [Hymenobacter properus]MBF9141918.1 T9SS type A sorting domain-containing protein [Hymenobacter properus]MBR7720726.1 T9SS type A sorting domain-containing protein [Microvirga sp. SRT04]